MDGLKNPMTRSDYPGKHFKKKTKVTFVLLSNETFSLPITESPYVCTNYDQAHTQSADFYSFQR